MESKVIKGKVNKLDKSKWISHIFHVDLSDHGHLEKENVWLHASGARHPLVRHTDATRAALRQNAPKFRDIADERLTHYTETPVKLPHDQVLRVHIKHSLTHQGDWRGDHAATHACIVIPPKLEDDTVAPPDGGDPPPANHGHIDWVSTAKAMIFHHPDLITHDPDTAAIIFDYMDQDQSAAIYQMITNAQGTGLADVMRSLGPPMPDSGYALQVATSVYNAATDTSTDTYQLIPVQGTIDGGRDILTAMMIATKNDPDLQNKKWTQTTGQSTDNSSGGSGGNSPSVASGGLALDDDGFKPVLQITGEQYGSKITINDYGQRSDGSDWVKLTVENSYIRYLGVYISFYGADDDDDQPMDISNWTIDGGSVLSSAAESLNVEYDTMKFCDLVSAMNNFWAIPTGPPGSTTFTITFPNTQNGYAKDAVRAKVFCCGLGIGDDSFPRTVGLGGFMTGFVNLGIPAFMLGFAVAAQSYQPLYDTLGNPKVWVPIVVAGGVYFTTAFSVDAAKYHQFDFNSLTSLSSILFNQAATKALEWCEAQMAEEEAAEEIPFAGWIVVALNIATGVAQIAETIVEVLESPFHIDNTITAQITSQVTVHPDPRHQAWPQAPQGSTASCLCKMIFQSENRPTVSQTFAVPDNFTDETIVFSFDGNTLGGTVKFEVDYYIDNWIAARMVSAYMPNDQEHTDDVEIYLFQIPVPITSDTVFTHSALLTYQNEAYMWDQNAKAPTSTIADLNNANSDNALSLLANLSLSQRYGTLGISYKAYGTGLTDATTGVSNTQLYAFQNVDIPGKTMSDAKFTDYGFTGQSMLIYDPFPPKFETDADGNWVLQNGQPVPDPSSPDLGDYYLDPRKASNDLNEDGGYHLRKISIIGTDNIDPNTGDLLSYGRFPYFPDHVTMHPAGLVVGVSKQYGKIMITRLQTEGQADDALPVARNFAGKAQVKDRNGLLFQPLGVACSYDGTILILDQLSSAELKVARVQAFDFLGRPITCFTDDDNNPTAIMPLPTDVTYLDIQAVGNQESTFVLVLYYTGTGNEVSDYHVDFYHYGTKAEGSSLVLTVDHVPAARLAIDMWHTMYTLNYAMTTDGSGNPAGPTGTGTGPAGRTVPSVSEWVPSVPEA